MNKIDVWNNALSDLGGASGQSDVAGDIIQSDQGSNTDIKAVRWCSSQWELSYRQGVAMTQPDEARIFQELAASDSNVEKGDYDYAYPLPNNPLCLVPLHLTSEEDTSEDNRQSFKQHGRHLLTNSEDKYLEYIKELEDYELNVLPPFVVKVIARCLAINICVPMVGSERGYKLRTALTNELHQVDLPWARGLNIEDDYSEPEELWTATS